MGNAQRVINVMRQAIEQEVSNGARIEYLSGEVASVAGGAYHVSAYISGDTEESFYIRTHAGSYLKTGDYIVVGISEDGDSWVEQTLPYSLFSRLAVDYSRGTLYLGDGTVAPTNAGAYGQALLSGGPDASAYWGTIEGGSGGSPTGAAGGDLSGTYPNPSVVDDSHAHTSATVTPAGIGAATSGHNHDASYEAAGAVATHAGLSDPHTGYRLESADHTHASSGLQGGQIAHSALTGLTTGDPHTQYQLESEKNANNGYMGLNADGEADYAQLPMEVIRTESNDDNTTTSFEATGISFPIAANEIINVVIWGWYNRGAGTNAASGTALKFNGPSGASMRGQVWWTTTGTDWNTEMANTYNSDFPVAGMIPAAANAARAFRVEARITNSTNAGTITLYHRRIGGTAGDNVAIVAGTNATIY